MLTIEKIIILKDVNIFRYTPDDVLLDIAQVLHEEIVSPGELIVKEGEMGDTMYIIVNGKVEVRKNDKKVAEFGPREFFGELAALSPEVRTASVYSVENTLLFKIRNEELYEIMSGNFDLAKGIIEALCQRMRMITS